jgi:hypothetical protein
MKDVMRFVVNKKDGFQIQWRIGCLLKPPTSMTCYKLNFLNELQDDMKKVRDRIVKTEFLIKGV